MGGGLIKVSFFVFTLLFNTIIYLLWARIIFRYFRISPLNSVSKMVHVITDPVILPLSKLFSRNNKRISQYDWTSGLVLIVVEILKFVLIGAFFLTTWMPFQYVLLFTLADLIIKLCNFFFYTILIRALMSLINPTWNHPLVGVLYTLTEPWLRLGRKIIPDISGFDFSPLIILIILKIITLFISGSLPLPLI